MPIDEELEELLARSRPSLHVLRRILAFMVPYWRQAILPVCVEILWVVIWSFPPHLLKIAIDEFIRPTVESMGRAAQAAQTSLAAVPVPRWFWTGMGCVVALLVMLTLLQAFLSALQRLCMWQTCQGALNDLRNWLFGHIQRLSMDFFDREKQGRIIARVDRDVDNLEPLLAWVPLFFVHAVCAIAVVTLRLLSYDWRLCLLIVAMTPVVALGSWASERWGLPAYRRIRLSMSRMTSNIAENVTGVHVVQAFGREETNLGRFRGLLEEYKSNQLAGAFVRGVAFPGMLLIFGVANGLVIAYAAWAVPRGHMTIGEVPAAVLYVGMIYGPIMMIAHLYDHMLSSSAAAERVVQLMDREPSVVDAPTAKDIPTPRGDVRFEHVFFKYDDEADSPWILEDIDFEAKPGDIVALVGRTGSGKTSIINLIARFYQAQRGRVLIDGHDVREVTQRSLHRQMGIVLQESFLFTGTVMDNLKYGRPETTDDEAVAAAKALGSHDVILRLAQGYQTDVRERGSAISHGERQLICFTRALVANPRILILDEATSAVDTQTEALIQRALWKLMQGRTTFVVAHRLSTVRHADKILVVKGGRIIESGSHDQLMTLERTYAAMFEEFIREA